MTQDIEYGFCHCGCGERTTLAPQTSQRRGWVKGQPVHYLKGHNRQLSPVEYLEQECGYTTPCWVWQRSKNLGGYGCITADGTTRNAHRIYYERLVGPIPEGLQLDHLCRNRACVRPSHLEPVSRVENLRRGLGTKLTKEQVSTIRYRLATGVTQTTLASEFHITIHQIWSISAGRSWAGVV